MGRSAHCVQVRGRSRRDGPRHSCQSAQADGVRKRGGVPAQQGDEATAAGALRLGNGARQKNGASTVREAAGDAFRSKALRAAVLNEGLEALGELESQLNIYSCGVFCGTQVRHVTFPSTLKEIGCRAFSECRDLRHVEFREGSRLESIGKLCFSGSGLEEFVAPPRLRKIGGAAFWCCKNLKMVVLNEGLETIRDYHDRITCHGAF